MIGSVERTSKSGVKIGDRVGCFLSVVHDTALFLGWGTYVGDEVPPNEGHSSLTAYLSGLRQANPKILLDSGDVVWGCECWWGPEAEVKAECARMKKVINITMTEARLGKIPEGFEGHWGDDASQGDFFGHSGGGGGGEFWS
jgi:hypothetical protein